MNNQTKILLKCPCISVQHSETIELIVQGWAGCEFIACLWVGFSFCCFNKLMENKCIETQCNTGMQLGDFCKGNCNFSQA